MVLKLVFCERLVYSRNEGYRTPPAGRRKPKTTLPFSILGGLLGEENKMVPQEGLEPPRPCEQQILSLPRLPFHH